MIYIVSIYRFDTLNINQIVRDVKPFFEKKSNASGNHQKEPLAKLCGRLSAILLFGFILHKRILQTRIDLFLSRYFKQ